MKRQVIGYLALSCLALLSATDAKALANRVFVSARSGNDANSCDNILAPCQTFAGAVTKLNPGGEVIVLDTGGYGPVNITQSVTIEAPPGVTAFIHPPSGSGITINAGSSDKVVLRGLVLNGESNYGIRADTVGTLHIENCVVSGFGGNGIVVLAPGSSTFVKDTISRQNGFGILVLKGRASIDHCRFEDNRQDGVAVGGADVTIRESVSAGNGGNGFTAFSGTSENTVLNLYQCMSTNNISAGLFASNTGTGFVIARVANSSISENLGIGLDNAGGGGSVFFESLGNNFARGNIGGDTAGTITVIAPK